MRGSRRARPSRREAPRDPRAACDSPARSVVFGVTACAAPAADRRRWGCHRRAAACARVAPLAGHRRGQRGRRAARRSMRSTRPVSSSRPWMMPVAPRAGGRLTALSVDEGARESSAASCWRASSRPIWNTRCRRWCASSASRARSSSAPRTWWRKSSCRPPSSTAPAANCRRRGPRWIVRRRCTTTTSWSHRPMARGAAARRRDRPVHPCRLSGLHARLPRASLRVAAEVDEEDIVRVAVGQEGDSARRCAAEPAVRRRGRRDHAEGGPGKRSYRAACASPTSRGSNPAACAAA